MKRTFQNKPVLSTALGSASSEGLPSRTWGRTHTVHYLEPVPTKFQELTAKLAARHGVGNSYD